MLEIKELKKTPRTRALKKRSRGTYQGDKPPVFTIVNRETGYTIFNVVKNLSKKIVNQFTNKYVEYEAVIFTDEYTIYHNLINHEKVKEHHTVNHGNKEYANGIKHVNSDENRHSLLRRFMRIFRGVSKKNLQGYILLEQYRINYKTDSYDKILQTILSI